MWLHPGSLTPRYQYIFDPTRDIRVSEVTDLQPFTNLLFDPLHHFATRYASCVEAENQPA